MEKSLVSIIIPIYNVEKYLDRCISSVINQTYENLEIILVDDGSPDNCPNICDKWVERDKRIKVIHQINGGLPAARNSGLDISRGEFIYFVDSDDWIAKNTIEDNVMILQQENADVVCFNYYLVRGGKAEPGGAFKVSQNSDDLCNDILMRRLPVSVWSKIYRASLWENVRFREKMTTEDWYIMPDVLLRSNKIVCNGGCYYYRNRDNEGSIQNNFKVIEFYYEFLCLNNILKYEHQLSQQLLTYFFNERFKRAIKVYEYDLLSGHFGSSIIAEIRPYISYDKKLSFDNKLRWFDFSTIKLVTLIKSVEYYFRIQ